MSELERKLAGDGLVITAELPMVDGGGLDAVRQRARAVRAVGRRDQRDRQHGRARARLQRRDRDRAQAARRRADHAGRLPRQEPARAAGRHRRRGAARRREHLLPDRRRRDRGRRAGGAPRLRPRRPAADRHRGRDRARRSTSRAARSSPRRTSSSAPSRTPARRRSPTAPQRALKKAHAGARFLQLQICYHPAQLEAFCAEGARIGLFERTRAPADDLPRRGRAPARVHGRATCPASRCPRPTIERVKTAADPREEAYQLGLEQARHALAQPGVRGLHLISFRKDDASAACASGSAYPQRRSETRVHTVLQSRSRTVTIAIDQPFCIIGERINPTGRKAFAARAARGRPRRSVIEDADAQIAMGAHVLDVNMGVPLIDEAELLAQTIRLIQEPHRHAALHRLLGVEALEAGLAAYEGKALVNSVTGEDERMELDPAARRQARRRGDRPDERRDRHPRDRREAARDRPQDRLGRAATTASRPRTS